MGESNVQTNVCWNASLVLPFFLACVGSHIGLYCFRAFLDYLAKHPLKDDKPSDYHYDASYVMCLALLIASTIYTLTLPPSKPVTTDPAINPDNCSETKVLLNGVTAFSLLFSNKLYNKLNKTNANRFITNDANQGLLNAQNATPVLIL